MLLIAGYAAEVTETNSGILERGKCKLISRTCFTIALKPQTLWSTPPKTNLILICIRWQTCPLTTANHFWTIKAANTNTGTEGTTAAQLSWGLNPKCQCLMKIKPKMPMPQCFATWKNGQHCSQQELVTMSWLLNSEHKPNHPEQPGKKHLQLCLQINAAAKIIPCVKEQGQPQSLAGQARTAWPVCWWEAQQRLLEGLQSPAVGPSPTWG